MALKITILIGAAGIIGSVLSKEMRFSDATNFFSSSLKVVTRHLQQQKDGSNSATKPRTDTLLAQVNSLRQELQMLASSRSVTVVTSTRSGSRAYGIKAILVVGCFAYGFIWWKGWKLSDMMFVTRHGFSGACSAVGKQLELVSSSITSAKHHLSSKIDVLDNSIDEVKGLHETTKNEVMLLHGDASLVHIDVESVTRAVRNLESNINQLEHGQNFAGRGLYALCKFAEGWNTKYIQESPCNLLQPAIDSPGSLGFSRAVSLPPPSLESQSPSSMESPRILRPSITVSAASLKELQEVSNPIRRGNFRASPSIASNTAYSVQQPSSSTSNTSRFRWKIPSIDAFTKSWSNAN